MAKHFPNLFVEKALDQGLLAPTKKNFGLVVVYVI